MKKINFLATDGVILNGLMYNAQETKSKDVILTVHGMSSNCFNDRDDIFAKIANENNIDYFTFNTRGSELVKYIKKSLEEGKKERLLSGTSYEDVLEGYEDIVGALLKLEELGYENIYLQGHSLGCTKIVYTYNELKEEEDKILDNVKAVILLSLVDIPTAVKVYLRDKYDEYLQLAEKMEQEGKLYEFMPKDTFKHLVSVKTFLRYARDNKEIDFANYEEDAQLEKLNNIEVPLFMRWGNDNEMIIQKADELVDIVKNKIQNDKKDINYIDGANHSYEGKEEILAQQIISFIKNIK